MAKRPASQMSNSSTFSVESHEKRLKASVDFMLNKDPLPSVISLQSGLATPFTSPEVAVKDDDNASQYSRRSSTSGVDPTVVSKAQTAAAAANYQSPLFSPPAASATLRRSVSSDGTPGQEFTSHWINQEQRLITSKSNRLYLLVAAIDAVEEREAAAAAAEAAQQTRSSNKRRKVTAQASAPAPASASASPSAAPKKRAAPRKRSLATETSTSTPGTEVKRARAPANKKPKVAAYIDVVNYCPPITHMNAAVSLKSNDGKYAWETKPSSSTTKSSPSTLLTSDPLSHLVGSELNELEVHLAASLNVDINKYLTNKRHIFQGLVHRLVDGEKTFSKTHAQGAGTIDVNKSSRMWEFFRLAGWLEMGLFGGMVERERRRPTMRTKAGK